MSPVPLAQIIFYLATLFMPNTATTFTLSSGYDQKITWVRQADGGWQATTDSGQAGIWSAGGLSVSVVDYGKTNKTDLSQYITVVDLGGQSNHWPVVQPPVVRLAILDGRPVITSVTNSSITFSQDKHGILSKPAVITYSAK